jgi:photosystem II stability/assembly factor-like uncharacterized protein
MTVFVGTRDGLWHINGTAERAGLAGKNVVHVADRNDLVLGAVPHDGLYEVSGAGERRLWDGDARSAAIGSDGALYVGTEPAMLFRSDDHGDSWTRLSAIDELPTRAKWYFPADVHEPHVRSIDFVGDAPSRVLVGVEVGGVLLSGDRGETWQEMNNGVYVDVHAVRADPTLPARMVAVTGAGVYLSEDGAASWQELQVGSGEHYAVGVHFNAAHPGEVLIATGDRPPGLNARVFRSVDGGHSWTQVSDSTLPDRYARVPVVLYADGSAWLLTDTGQAYRADDAGSQWSLVSEVHTTINAASAGGAPSSVNYGYA